MLSCPTGKHHYHLYLKFADALDTKNVKFFDILGVHPNVIRAPGKGWIAYCAKEKEFVTNFYESDPSAINLEDLAIHGKAIKENLEMNKKRKIIAPLLSHSQGTPWFQGRVCRHSLPCELVCDPKFSRVEKPIFETEKLRKLKI